MSTGHIPEPLALAASENKMNTTPKPSPAPPPSISSQHGDTARVRVVLRSLPDDHDGDEGQADAGECERRRALAADEPPHHRQHTTTDRAERGDDAHAAEGEATEQQSERHDGDDARRSREHEHVRGGRPVSQRNDENQGDHETDRLRHEQHRDRRQSLGRDPAEEVPGAVRRARPAPQAATSMRRRQAACSSAIRDSARAT